MRKISCTLVIGLLIAALLHINGLLRAQADFANPPPLSSVTTIPLDGHPKGIAVNPATNQIYVALFDTSRVARVDGATNAIVNSHDTGGLHPNQIAFNPANQQLYITNRDSDELSFMDSNSLNVMAKYRVGSQPWGVAVDPMSNQVYVNNFGAGSISLLDGTNGALIKTFTNGSMSRPSLATYSAGMRRYYGLDWETGQFFVIDANRQLYAPFSLGYGAFDVAVDETTEKVYLTNRETGQDEIADGAVPDPNALRVNVFDVFPAKFFSIAVNPNTQHYFIVASYQGRQVVLVRDMRTWDVLQIMDTGSVDENDGGQGLEVNLATNRVYVSNYADSTLVVLQDSTSEPTATLTPTDSLQPTDTPTSTPTDVVSPAATATATPTAIIPPAPTPTATAPLSGLPYVLTTFNVGAHPKGVTIDGLRRWYGMVALFDDSRIVGFNVTDFQVADGGTSTQGTHPNQILYAGSNRLHITNRDSNNYVGLAWNGPGSNCWAPTGELPWGIAATYERVYVGNFGSSDWGSVSVFNLQCLLQETISLPNDRPALMTSTHGKVYVAGWAQGNLYVIERDNNLRNPVNIGPGAFGLAAHGTAPRVYLTNRDDGRLYIIDATNDNIIGITNLPGKAYAVASNYKTNHVFVVDAVNDRVYIVDGTTGALLVTLPVGHQDADNGGQGIAVSLENNRVFVANYADGTMTVIQDVELPALAARTNACPAPQLASWHNGATIPYRRVTLDWSDPACATRYEIEIRKNSSKGKIVASSRTVPISQYTTAKALKPGKTFAWHVRACNETRCSKWSEWWKFAVAADAK